MLINRFHIPSFYQSHELPTKKYDSLIQYPPRIVRFSEDNRQLDDIVFIGKSFFYGHFGDASIKKVLRKMR